MNTVKHFCVATLLTLCLFASSFADGNSQESGKTPPPPPPTGHSLRETNTNVEKSTSVATNDNSIFQSVLELLELVF
jgi:hypothetical protein